MRFTPSQEPIRGDDPKWKRQVDTQIGELQRSARTTGSSGSSALSTNGGVGGSVGPVGPTPALYAETVDSSPLVDPREAEEAGEATFVVADTGGLLVGNYVQILRTGTADTGTSVEGAISSITPLDDGTNAVTVDVIRGDRIASSDGEIIRRNLAWNPDTVGINGYTPPVSSSISLYETPDGWIRAEVTATVSVGGTATRPAATAKYSADGNLSWYFAASPGRQMAYRAQVRNPNSVPIRALFTPRPSVTSGSITVAAVAGVTINPGATAVIEYAGLVDSSNPNLNGISAELTFGTTDAFNNVSAPSVGQALEFTKVLFDIGDLASATTPVDYFSPNDTAAYASWEGQANRSPSYLRDNSGNFVTSWSAWTLRLSGRSGTGSTTSGLSLSTHTYGLGFKDFLVTRQTGERQRFTVSGRVPVRVTTYLDSYTGYMTGTMYASGGSPTSTVYTMEVTGFQGSGTYSSWEIQVIGERGETGAVGPTGPTGPAGPGAAAPYGYRALSAPQTGIVSGPASSRVAVAFSSATDPVLNGMTRSGNGLRVPSAGVYMLITTMNWETNANGSRNTWVRINNGVVAGTTYIYANTTGISGAGLYANGVTVLNLAANDLVETMVHQNSGATLRLEQDTTSMALIKIA